MLAVAGLLGWARGASADEPSERISDDQFVAKAACCGSTEVEMGKLALRNGESAQVKTFGQRLLIDHNAADQKLLAMAGRKQIVVPRTLDAKHQEEINKLAKLQGAEFDRAFAEQMVKDHKAAIDLFESESKNGKDAEIKDYARQTLPNLKQHLRMARDLNSEKDDKSVK
jgi:putative membrane protein